MVYGACGNHCGDPAKRRRGKVHDFCQSCGRVGAFRTQRGCCRFGSAAQSRALGETWQRLLGELVEAVNITSPAAFQAKISAATHRAERVILDCPPGLPDTGLMAALLADLVILPVTPSPLDIIAGQEAMAMVREARVKRNNTKPLIRFAPARVSVNTLLSRDLTAALERLGEPVLPSTNQRVVVAEAVIHGLTVGEYAPESKAHEEFKQLAVAVERIVK